jgi:hypothetical protein
VVVEVEAVQVDQKLYFRPAVEPVQFLEDKYIAQEEEYHCEEREPEPKH